MRTNQHYHNPDVVKSVQRFEEGDMRHGYDICKTCFETRPKFHATSSINASGQNVTKPFP